MSLIAAMLLAAPGGWFFTEKADPITDRRLAMASYGEGAAYRVAVGCTAGSGGEVGAIVIFDEYLGYANYPQISYRFDALSPTTVSVVTNGKQAQIARPPSTKLFVDLLRRSKRLAVQMIEDDGTVHNAIFNLPEPSDDIGKVLAVCNPIE